MTLIQLLEQKKEKKCRKETHNKIEEDLREIRRQLDLAGEKQVEEEENRANVVHKTIESLLASKECSEKLSARYSTFTHTFRSITNIDMPHDKDAPLCSCMEFSGDLHRFNREAFVKKVREDADDDGIQVEFQTGSVFAFLFWSNAAQVNLMLATGIAGAAAFKTLTEDDGLFTIGSVSAGVAGALALCAGLAIVPVACVTLSGGVLGAVVHKYERNERQKAHRRHMMEAFVSARRNSVEGA